MLRCRSSNYRRSFCGVVFQLQIGYRKVHADSSFGDFEWRTYAQSYATVRAFSAGLRKLCPHLRRQERVGIYSRNNPDMFYTIHGVQAEDLVVVDQSALERRVDLSGCAHDR